MEHSRVKSLAWLPIVYSIRVCKSTIIATLRSKATDDWHLPYLAFSALLRGFNPSLLGRVCFQAPSGFHCCKRYLYRLEFSFESSDWPHRFQIGNEGSRTSLTLDLGSFFAHLTLGLAKVKPLLRLQFSHPARWRTFCWECTCWGKRPESSL